MSYFITKYALTEGIRIIDNDSYGVDGGMLWNNRDGYYFHGEGKEWHRTKESAVKRAEEMRLAKIASLKKSIAKLEKLKF